MDTQTIVTSMTDHTRCEGRIFQIGSVAGIVGSLLAMVGNLLHPATPGYENISHFRRLFALHIGVTPGAIRRAPGIQSRP